MENVLADLAPEILPKTNAFLVKNVMEHLICPDCRASSFRMYSDESTSLPFLEHAVVVCLECQTCYHFDEGILEMLKDRPENLTMAQKTNFWPIIPTHYQKYWRSWCMTVMCGRIYSNARESALLLESLNLDQLSEDAWIVDIGTSHAFYAIAIAELLKKIGSPAKIVAIDFSKKMLKEAFRRAKQYGVDDQILFILANVESIPLRDDFAHRVSCGGSLNEYRHPDIALAEVSRILKTDGIFFAMNLFLKSIAWPILKLLSYSGLTFHRLAGWNERYQKLFNIRSQSHSGIIMFSSLSKL